MSKMKHLLLLNFLFVSCLVYSQSVEGVALSKYPAVAEEVKKRALINWQTNPFKNKIKEIRDGYEKQEVSFAGYYTTILWKKGVDTILGVMIDTRSGIIYKLPISASNCSNKCMDVDDIFDRYLFLPSSKLFVTSVCRKVKLNSESKVRQEFYFYLWNEATKKFSLIKQTKKERILN